MPYIGKEPTTGNFIYADELHLAQNRRITA
jgi:hypothetical protein